LAPPFVGSEWPIKKPPAAEGRGLVKAKLKANGCALISKNTYVGWAPLYRVYYYTLASIESS
jgi:hypothetical protein